MTFCRALVCCLAAAFLAAGSASAEVRIGVADDLGIHGDQSEWFFDNLGELGMTENRVFVPFDPAEPTTIQNQAALDLYVPLASLRGVRVVFSVAPVTARALSQRPQTARQFAEYVALLATTYPTVKDFIVGNEPNQPRFQQPQFDRAGRNVSAAAYYSMLAASYDALKAVDPAIKVIGLGLSPRGNDQPRAYDNVSTSPVRFLHALGNAYRRSGRTKPIMDELAFHPYPDHDRDPLMKGYRWPNAGVPNLGRIKQAFWDAFRATGQPTFGEGRSRGRLTFRLDELGWQAAVPYANDAYHGRESVLPTDERSQAAIYRDAIRYLACDASVSSILFFLLRDEADLERWQAGLVRADGSRRPSFDAVKAAFAATRGRCSGQMRPWYHSTAVDGARVTFPKTRVLPARRLSLALVANADEDAAVEASLYRGARRVLRQRSSVKAYRSRIVRFSTRFRPGRYTFRVTLRASLNPARSKSFSAPLRIRR
ncbi:MAG TPA: hypothetical protein VG144_04520 [Gaiellaceae bacterium]|jgi:hypothetical protein|nr:hypothetical protein [Gaiellaceae bacterium]